MTKKRFNKVKPPNNPGVYFFLGNRREILYIGRATSLKSRIRSYFDVQLLNKRSELIEQMVLETKLVEWTVTDSVLEAMLLETNLIRTHKPKYNTISKDDKSYNHLIITNENWPRLLVVRAKDLTERFTENEIKYTFGPFPHGQLFREALKIIRRIFQYYDTKKPIDAKQSRLARGQIDFNKQLGLYPIEQDKKKYIATIRHIKLLFEGKKPDVIRDLKRSMMQAAKEEKFEFASEIKRKIFSLEHIQDVALLKNEARNYQDEKRTRVEAYDVAHLQGTEMVGVMTVVESGQVRQSEYRKFIVKSVSKANDTAALQEVLERRLGHPEWPLPNLLVVDGSTAQKNIVEKVLKKYQLSIPVAAVVKDEKHKPIRILAASKLQTQFHNDILMANSEAHRFSITYHPQKRRKKLIN